MCNNDTESMSQTNFFEDMPEKSQQLSSHYLAILAMEGMGAILDWKGQKIKKNGQVLTK